MLIDISAQKFTSVIQYFKPSQSEEQTICMYTRNKHYKSKNAKIDIRYRRKQSIC